MLFCRKTTTLQSVTGKDTERNRYRTVSSTSMARTSCLSDSKNPGDSRTSRNPVERVVASFMASGELSTPLAVVSGGIYFRAFPYLITSY